MNPVLYWNAVLLEMSRRDHSQGYANGQQPGPTNTSRAMAIVHLAIHDAVAFVVRPGAAYLQKKHGTTLAAPAGAALEDCVDGAAVTALRAMYPQFGQYLDDATPPAQAPGFAFGATVADAIVAARAGDGSAAPATATQAAHPSAHRPDPYTPAQGLLSAQWGGVAHFVGPRVPLADFPGRGAPDALADAHYRADFEEVRDLGAYARGARTAEQTLIGVYWGYDGAQGIGVPPRLYNQIARKIVADPNLLGVPEAAALFAQLNVAMADAGIDAWHYKYVQDLWRPVVGIRGAGAPDGDAFWAPLGAPQTNLAQGRPRTPPFPAYPSGHATFGAALFQTLRRFLTPGTAPLTVADVLAAEDPNAAPVAGEAFAFVSDELDGRAGDPDGSVRTHVERQFPSYARAVWENSVSRVYLGVHWRFDGLPRDAAANVGGVPLGLVVAAQVHDFFAAGPSLGTP